MAGMTDRQIGALKPIEGKQYTRSGLGMRGLSIVVSYGGSKVFYYRYTTHEGKQGRLKLGRYHSGFGLSEARKAARAASVQVDNGKDPARERIEKREAAKRMPIKTMTDLWDDYRKKKGLAKRSAEFELTIWRTHIKPHFGKMDVQRFSRISILDFLDVVRVEKSPSLANRIQFLITRLAAHAMQARVIDVNPAHDLGKKPEEKARDRKLTEAELESFWIALNTPADLNRAKVSLLMAQALKLAALTLCRRKEIIGSEWIELNRAAMTLTLPAKRVKNGKEHIVPISEAALSVIDKANEYAYKQSPFIFPSPRTDAALTQDAMTKACRRLAAHLEIAHFTPHDLRRTGASYLTSERFKVSRFVVSRVLNHLSDKGGGSASLKHYDVNSYLTEKREALDAWGTYLSSMTMPKDL